MRRSARRQRRSSRPPTRRISLIPPRPAPNTSRHGAKGLLSLADFRVRLKSASLFHFHGFTMIISSNGRRLGHYLGIGLGALVVGLFIVSFLLDGIIRP